MPSLTQQNGVYVLTLGENENRFTPDWLTQVEDAFDKVVAAPAPLVTTGSGKFFSNGLDLEWIATNIDQRPTYVATVQALLARVLTLPVPTIAAINGHAFGAGAMLALAHDWRVMRADRGYICFPEVDLGIPFAPGMSALVQGRLTPRQALDAMTTGRRFRGPEAVTAGLVDDIASEEDLEEGAAAMVRDLTGKSGATLAIIKSTMYADIVRRLIDAPAADD